MIGNFVDSILNLPPDILSQWGYFIVLFFSVIESLPLIGLAIPGGVVVLAAGFFAKLGILNLFYVIGIVFLGAFIGDLIAYFLGRRYGYNLLIKIGRFIFFKPSHFERAKKVLQTHPGKAIFGGRFHALTRCIIPFAAGSAGLSPAIFLPFAALSALSWATVNVLAGFVFGQGFEIASRYLGTVFFIALALGVLVVYSYQFINRFTTRNKHIIQRYQIYPLFLNLISIAIIAKITDSVLTGTGIRHFDNVVYTFFQKIHSPFLTDFFIVITAIATPTNLIILSCLLVAYFMYQKRWYFLALLPLSLLAGVISNSILKKLVHLSRPFFPLVPTTDFSFPSGHATLAIIFFGLVIYFFKDSIKSMLWRRFFVTLCIFCGLIICFSRLYVNAHWFSDVLAGMALGTFWVTFFIVLFHFFTSLSPKRMTQELEKEIKEEQDMLV